MATETLERTEAQEAQEARTTTLVERRRTGFVVLAIVVAALLGFALGWAVYRDTGTDVPGDVEQLLDDYVDAWNTSDGQAAAALMTPSARFYAQGYTGYDGFSRDELVAWIDGVLPDQIEQLSTTVIGDDPYVVVVEGNVGTVHGHSIFMVDEIADQLLILDHIWMAD